MIIDGKLAKIGERESIADVARVLGREAVAIVWRTHGQERIEEMAAYAEVPVVNAQAVVFGNVDLVECDHHWDAHVQQVRGQV